MVGRLPESIDPYDWAKAGRELVGRLPLAELGRLSGSLVTDQGSVEVALSFAASSPGQPTLTGQVACDVTLRCQRCLEPLSLRLHAPVKLAVVSSDAAAARLPSRYEPVVCRPGEQLMLADLVEDELLLALPDYPQHAQNACSALALPAWAAQQQRQPFAAVLESFKKR